MTFTMTPVIDVAQARRETGPVQREVVFDIQDLSVSYGRTTTAISGVDLDIYRNVITAVIGPSGCGKSTFIRCLNRMNDLVPGAKVDGRILYQGDDLPEVDLRQRGVGTPRARPEKGSRRAG